MDDVFHAFDGGIVSTGGEDVRDEVEGQLGAWVEVFDRLGSEDLVGFGLGADGGANDIAGGEGVDESAEAHMAAGAGEEDKVGCHRCWD